jgi:multicomponent Na+:H+ antiporter subunit G
MIVGMVGVFRFRRFFSRILITSTIESMGFLSILIGIVIYAGISFFALKTLLIMALFVLTNPLSTHSIGRSAYLSDMANKGDSND